MTKSISVGHLERPWAKRVSVVIAVFSFLVFLFTLYPSNPIDPNFNYQLPIVHAFSIGLMVVSLSFLRRSSLNPANFATRDWAYRVGSRVLGRTTVGVFVLGSTFLIVVFLGDVITMTEVSPQLSSTVFQSSLAAVSEFIRFYFTGNAVFAALQLVGTVAFVACALPLGILAWKQAGDVDLVALEKLEVRSAKAIARMVAKRYHRRLQVFGYLVIATIVLWAPLSRVSFPANNGAIFYLLFGTVGYGIWVFGFGMFNQAFIIRILKRTKAGSPANQLGEGLYSQFLKSSITGSAMLMMILLLPFTTSLGWGAFYLVFAVFGGGIALLALHLSAFESIKQFGRVPKLEEE